MKRLFLAMLVVLVSWGLATAGDKPSTHGAVITGMVFELRDNSKVALVVSEKNIIHHEIIEWEKVSVTTPVIPMGLAIYAPPICNYAGQKYLVKYVLVNWGGSEYEFELDRMQISTKESLNKSEICQSY